MEFHRCSTSNLVMWAKPRAHKTTPRLVCTFRTEDGQRQADLRQAASGAQVCRRSSVDLRERFGPKRIAKLIPRSSGYRRCRVETGALQAGSNGHGRTHYHYFAQAIPVASVSN